MSAPTVARVEGIPFRLPLTSALAWGAHSALSAAEHVLVRVTLSDGTVGQAEATPRPTIYGETTASVLGILAREKRSPTKVEAVVGQEEIAVIHLRLNVAGHGDLEGIRRAILTVKGVQDVIRVGGRKRNGASA